MPYMKNGKRDYQREKEWDHKHGRIADRAQRNKARSLMMKAGKVKKGDGKDVDHVKALSKGGPTSLMNLQVVPASKNRSFSRNSNGSMRSQTSKRERKK